MVSSSPLPINSSAGNRNFQAGALRDDLSLFFRGQLVNTTPARATATPAIFNAVAFSLYRNIEKTKGITSDNLLATDATATLICCAVIPMTFNKVINVAPTTID